MQTALELEVVATASEGPSHKLAACLSSESDEWHTPRDLYARLDAEFGFLLDAACTRENCLARFGHCVDLGRSGLREHWHVPHGAVWCNPPYSDIAAWMAKAKHEGQRVPVVCLIPARTDTRWWAESVAKGAAEVRFITGRLRFTRPDGSGDSAPFPSAVIVYRPGHVGDPVVSYMPARVVEPGPMFVNHIPDAEPGQLFEG